MIVTEIRCDGCDVLGDTSRNRSGARREHAHQIRHRLSRDGWISLGGKDYCQGCHVGWRPKSGARP